ALIPGPGGTGHRRAAPRSRRNASRRRACAARTAGRPWGIPPPGVKAGRPHRRYKQVAPAAGGRRPTPSRPPPRPAATRGPPMPPGPLPPTAKKNVEAIAQVEQQLLGRRSRAERIADGVARFFGSPRFVLAHALGFAGWAVLNTGVVPGVQPFDPYPFAFL